MAAADPVSTRTFHLLSRATADQVWRALTCPQRSPRFLHGLAVHGSWEPDALLRFRCPGGLELTGTVLYSEPPYRLSLTIEDEASGGCTYLTWRVREACGGTIVQLQVDEGFASEGDGELLEETWLPALAALDELLQA